MKGWVALGIATVAFWWTWRRGGEEQTVPQMYNAFQVRMHCLNEQRKDRQRRRGKTC